MEEHPELNLESEYVAGLLDGVSRVNFDVSESADGSFHIRPLLRIKPFGTELRRNVIGSVLEREEIDYRYVVNSNRHNYFAVDGISHLRQLRELIAGESVQLIRGLDFIFEVFLDEFEGSLSPDSFYQFLLTREELQYGYQFGGPHDIRQPDVASEFNVATEEIEPLSIPDGSVRGSSSIDWVAGVFDGLARFRPSVWRDREYEIGFGMSPTVQMYKGATHPLFSHFVASYFRDRELSINDYAENPHQVKYTISGTPQVAAVLDDLLDHLLVLAEHSLIMLEEILPRFEMDLDHEKQGFYDLLVDFERVSKASGDSNRQKKYHPEFFKDQWGEEISTSI